MKSFAIIGLGLFGEQLAKDLFKEGHNVLAIDKDEEIVERIADSVSKAVVFDAKNRNALAHIGIDKYDCAVLCTSSDLAASVIITMNLKALNVPKIVCKVQNETDQEVLEALGASSCMVPEHIAAINFSKRLSTNNVLDFTQLSDEYGIMEIKAPESWINKSILELNIRSQYKLNIMAIRHEGKLIVDFPPTFVFSDSDELIMIGNNNNLTKVQKLK
ncbi:MAG: TrkA family potassium uptake protein [Lachnospiraceae bacterium]|nr:TrkA family potassium uptake protein [Lachnospiraceae bacterium]